MNNYKLSIKDLFVAILAGSYSLLLFTTIDIYSDYIYFVGVILFVLYFSNIIKQKALNLIVKISFVISYLYMLFTVVDSHGLKILGVIIFCAGIYCNETRPQVTENA